MATIAIGDIHGNLQALNDLLRRLENEVGAGDTLVFLGDYIDRGPDSKACIERIIGLSTDTAATVVGLVGNHEDWLLRTYRNPTRHSWLLGMEAFDTIESYSFEAARALRTAAQDAGERLYLEKVELPYDLFFDAVPPSHLAFLENLRTYHRTVDAICVHGGVDPRGGLPEDQARDALVWGTPGFQSQYRGKEILVYGHWHNTRCRDDGRPEPLVVGRTVGIDTIGHGVLTALRLPDLTVFQSGAPASWVLDAAGGL